MSRVRLQGQPVDRRGETWDPNLILRAKKAWRANATLAECKAILNSAVGDVRFRQLARKHGMTWAKVNSIHAGTSTLMQRPMSRL